MAVAAPFVCVKKGEKKIINFAFDIDLNHGQGMRILRAHHNVHFIRHQTNHEWISKNSLSAKRRLLSDNAIGHVARVEKSIRARWTEAIEVCLILTRERPILIRLLLLWWMLLRRHRLEWIKWIYWFCYVMKREKIKWIQINLKYYYKNTLWILLLDRRRCIVLSFCFS